MNIKVIIPACGFGTRLNMPIDQSKEMLLDEGKPIIEYVLNLCKQYDLEPLVITRKEKQDLIDYLDLNKIAYMVSPPGEEWPQTVLKSEPYWADKNILILPDTRFNPIDVLKQIKQSLEFGIDISYGIHNVSDVSKWGCVNKYFYCEKPNIQQPGTAWGLIGFTKAAGYTIFKNMSIRGRFAEHEYSTNFIFLDSFVDITRGNEIK